MKLKTALILAGGKGTRLSEHTEDLPKPLIPVGGVPLLERIILWLKKNGVENIILGVAYKKEMIINYFNSGTDFGVKIDYVEHDMNGGTEDAFKADIEQALKRDLIKEENFYAMNGDQITDLDLEDLSKAHIKNKAIVTVTTVNLKTNFGVVEKNKKNQITEFQEKGELKDKIINSGIYVFNKKIKDYLEGGSIEEKAFRKLIKEKKIYSFYHPGIWLTMNDKKEMKKIEEFLGEYGESFEDEEIKERKPASIKKMAEIKSAFSSKKALMIIRRKGDEVSKFAEEVTKRLSERGYKVDLFSREEDLGFLDLSSSMRGLRDFVKKKMNEENYEKIYTFDWSLAFPLLFPSGIFKDKHFCFFYDFEPRGGRSKILQKITAGMLGDHLVVKNNKLKEKFRKAKIYK